MKLHLLITFALLWALTSCIDDSVTRDSSSQPQFSDTKIEMAPLLSGQSSPVYKLKVFNPAGKAISIEHISVSGNDSEFYSFNIDGHSGTEFSDIEIRGGDSIFVFIQSIAPERGSSISCSLNFSTAGKTSSIPVNTPVIEATVLNAPQITSDLTWEGNYYIHGNATVANGTVLTLRPYTNIYFADNSSLTVNGSLVAEGTAEALIILQGDRFDNIIPDVSYSLIAGQWKGLTFGEGARGTLSYTSVLNAENNISAREGSELSLFNCQIHNASDNVLTLDKGKLQSVGCEYTDAGKTVLAITSSEAGFIHSTIANFYLLAYPVEPIINLSGNSALNFNNSIIYGLSPELSSEKAIDNLPIYFRHCMFNSPGENDSNFIDCIWNTDPLLNIAREEYIFDYTPSAASSALNSGDSSLTPETWNSDRFGNKIPETPPIGAYSVNIR